MFVLLTAKEELTTKTGKPYFKVTFRGRNREVSFPIWDNSPWAAECRAQWTPGVFYKVRAVYRETNFGPQLEIRKIREVVEADAADGFDPNACQPQSRFDPEQMFEELMAIVRERIDQPALRQLVESISHKISQGNFDVSGRPAQSSCFCRRIAGTHLERDANLHFSGRQIRGLLSRHAAAVEQEHGRGRGDSARYRQAAGIRMQAGRSGVLGRRRVDRPHAPRPRHRPRGGGRDANSTPIRCCGWSTSLSPISACPNGDRRSRP